MQRHEALEMMATLKLAGMRAAFDPLMADGLKRQHSALHILGELLKAEIAEKRARSIAYQLGIARLPLARSSRTSSSRTRRSTKGSFVTSPPAPSSHSNATSC